MSNGKWCSEGEVSRGEGEVCHGYKWALSSFWVLGWGYGTSDFERAYARGSVVDLDWCWMSV